MPEIFTNYIRNLSSGDETDDLAFLSHLKSELLRQLRAIGQLNQSPSFLGYQGVSWRSPDVIDDLVQDVYRECILENIEKLAVMVAQNGTCEGAVVQKITWTLESRHTKGNPAAKRIFKNLREASRRLIVQRIAFQLDEHLVFRSATIVLRVGAREPAAYEELLRKFQHYVGIHSTAETLSVDNESGVSQWLCMLQEAFEQGLTGFRAGELSNLFASSLRGEVVQSTDSDDKLLGFFRDFQDPRTAGISARYSDTQVQSLGLSAEELRNIVSSMNDISKEKAEQFYKLIDVLVELINDEMVDRPTIRLIAEKLGKGKSVVGDMIKFLRAACTVYLNLSKNR